MALLSVTAASRAALNLKATTSPAAAASATGDRFPNTGKEVLVVFPNVAGSAVNVTCETTATMDGQAIPDNVVAVSDSDVFIIGPFPVSVYGDTVYITYDVVTNTFVQVIKVGS